MKMWECLVVEHGEQPWANLLADKMVIRVYLCGYEQFVTKCIAETHINKRYLPEIQLSPISCSNAKY